jgi:uncharacterized protein (DUF488 family)
LGPSAPEVATGELVELFTIGHSTHPIDEFLAILKSHAIERLVDIRTVPRSRHNPQFNRESLPSSLAAAGIGYVHMPGLGGLRLPRKDSINTGWRNDSFRGYADYMQTADFGRSLEELIALASSEHIAIMCAESVPWRCHRSLVADALTARGIAVRHIMSSTSAKAHVLTPFVHVDGRRLTYPGLPVMTVE